MNKFDSFYFLHIPKTAGRFFNHNVVVPLDSTLTSNGINNFYNRDTYVAHQFWTEDITDKTYVTSLIREPVKHFVSVYSHYAMLNDEAQRAVPVGLEQYNKTTMFEWMEKYSEYLSNLQSKNFLMPRPEDSFVYGENTKSCIVEKDILFDRLKNVALLLRSEDLKASNIDKIHQKILNDFNIEYKGIDYKMQRASNYWNPDSTRIYNSLNSSDVNRILEFSSMDAEIFNTQSLFFDLDS